MLRFLLAVLSGTLLSAVAQTNPYESEIRAFEQADLRNPPATNSILFIGSSTIVRWQDLMQAFPRYNVLNRGFGGSELSDVLFFFDRVVTPYHPPLIVFYEGDNDLAGGKSVDRVFGDWTNFVSRVKAELPTTDIMFVSVKPSPSRISILPKMRELNERVREQAEADARIYFVDTFTPMLNASGQPRQELFVSDNLHMSEAGYALWRSILGPALDAWAADYPVVVAKPVTGSVLIDFGSTMSPSGTANAGETFWNNVTPTIGGSSSGVLSNIVTTRGAASHVVLRMVSRFNGANENGTVASAVYPANASRDSLFGNTETFSGLANVTPIFQLTGLENASYRITFYASRLAVNDNRETRYTIAGAGTNSVDLNAANNVDNTAVLPVVAPEAGGALTISLAPGPNNNNANHFTYLGALRVDDLSSGDSFLFDFGAAGAITSTEQSASGPAWNDLTEAIGAMSNGVLTNLVQTNGAPSGVWLQMVSRFNGANTDGTRGATNYPASATQDSLFGNTEIFNGLAEVRPAFKLNGLNARALYDFNFFASRTGVSDNRETRYTVTGANSGFAELNASNNTNGIASLVAVRPLDGAITVELSPGGNNSNANHFTYLNLLELRWTIPPERTLRVLSAHASGGLFEMSIRGTLGAELRVEASRDLKSWNEVKSFRVNDDSELVTFATDGGNRFFRVVEE